MSAIDIKKAAAERVHMVSPETLHAWLQDDACVLVDVREPHEYAAGHVEGAHLVPLSTFSLDQVPVDPAKKLVLHCRSANRCGTASLKMLSEGYEGEIYRMEGGFLYWVQQGLPIEV